MNVYVPYTELRTETRAAVGSARYIDVSSDDEAYWRLLDRLWSAGRSFILVEHDIVPPDGALAQMWLCAAEWCGVPYPIGNIFGAWNGCTKYGRDLIRRFPDVLTAIRDHHWGSLDSQIIAYLHRQDPRLVIHQHWPAAQHLNASYDTMGHVYANCGECGGPLRWTDLRNGPGQAVCPRCGRATDYFGTALPFAGPMIRRNTLGTKLHYVGDGRRYLHEDVSAGLEAVPPADFETDSPSTIAICLESGLYVLADEPSVDTQDDDDPAPADAEQAPSTEE